MFSTVVGIVVNVNVMMVSLKPCSPGLIAWTEKYHKGQDPLKGHKPVEYQQHGVGSGAAFYARNICGLGNNPANAGKKKALQIDE